MIGWELQDPDRQLELYSPEGRALKIRNSDYICMNFSFPGIDRDLDSIHIKTTS